MDESKIHILISNYNKINNAIDHIKDDIKQLSALHASLTNVPKDKFYDNGRYSDDIFFQKNLLNDENNLLIRINILMRQKLYGDLFKIYVRLIKFIKNNNMDHYTIKQCPTFVQYLKENNIKFFSIIDKTTDYDNSDIINLHKNIHNELREINEFIDRINQIITTTSLEETDGFPTKILYVDVNGQRDRLVLECKLVSEILENILNISIKLSETYVTKSENLAREVKQNAKDFAHRISSI